MNRPIFTLGVLLLVAGLAACDESMAAGADFDRGFDFTPFTTFAWEPNDGFPVGDPRLEGTPFFEERVHRYVSSELAMRGVRQVGLGETPDLLVHYHAIVRDRVDVYEVDRDAGYESPQFGPGVQVHQYEEGMLLIDLVQASTNRVIWRGWARADVTAALDHPQRLERLVEAAARRMFEYFPREG